jgi:5'-methylthioadenosine phosphorylase
MKVLGVSRVISVSAVGSLQEELRPLEFLIPDQFFDRTRQRISTFFGGGVVAHVGFDKPTCGQLGKTLGDACDAVGVKAHRGGTYICIEGPQFSTLSEAHVTGSCALVIDRVSRQGRSRLQRRHRHDHRLDCWHPEHSSVTVAEIFAISTATRKNAQNVLRAAGA